MGRTTGQSRFGGSAVLARINAVDLVALSLDKIEIFSRADSRAPTWQPLQETLDTGSAEELFGSAEAEASLMWSTTLGVWLTAGVQGSRGGAALTLRTAQTPEGPWSPPAVAASLNPDLLELGVYYAPKLHHTIVDGSSGTPGVADIAMSVVCAPLFGQLEDIMASPENIYVPLLFHARLAAVVGNSTNPSK